MEPENKSNDRFTRVLLGVIVIAIVGFLGAIYWLDHKNAGRNPETNNASTNSGQTKNSLTPTIDYTNIAFPIQLTNDSVSDAGLYYILIGRIQSIELTDSQSNTYQFTLLSPHGAVLNQTFTFTTGEGGTRITQVDNNNNESPATVSDIKQGSQIQFSYNIDFKRNPQGTIPNIIIHQQ